MDGRQSAYGSVVLDCRELSATIKALGFALALT